MVPAFGMAETYSASIPCGLLAYLRCFLSMAGILFCREALPWQRQPLPDLSAAPMRAGRRSVPGR